ncbi:MAG TPA: NAD-dependent epimerase/dehydratase family protein [Clostridiales bacterium]|nr:NAD-dependent epimerase/dehydratase family protein [Clostridiales bacterium]HQP70463.1 NAD-dependent epimerase/dehydratase family protein [Clostridiales bacterium]
MNMPILVSGGDGFIGRSIVDRLLFAGYSILVIDNHISSFPRKDTKNSNYCIFEKDISHIDVNDVPKVSGVIHLASIASPLVYKDNPSLVIDSNTLGTRNLIDIAKRDKVRILYASTSEIYGQLNDQITKGTGIKENEFSVTKLLTERSCYASAKRLGEELIVNFKRQGGDAGNFRLFNVYGKNMDLKHVGYGRVIPNFFNQMKKGEPVQIFGTGRQSRSFLWIDDAVDAILGLFFYEGELPSAVNIGRNESISIIDLAETISNVLGVSYKTSFLPGDEDDPQWRIPNTDLISALTGWKAKVSLREGLKMIADAEKIND